MYQPKNESRGGRSLDGTVSRHPGRSTILRFQIVEIPAESVLRGIDLGGFWRDCQLHSCLWIGR